MRPQLSISARIFSIVLMVALPLAWLLVGWVDERLSRLDRLDRAAAALERMEPLAVAMSAATTGTPSLALVESLAANEAVAPAIREQASTLAAKQAEKPNTLR